MWKRSKFKVLKAFLYMFNENRMNHVNFQRTTDQEDYSIYIRISQLLSHPATSIADTDDTFVVSYKDEETTIFAKITPRDGNQVNVLFMEMKQNGTKTKYKFCLDKYAIITFKSINTNRKLDIINRIESSFILDFEK